MTSQDASPPRRQPRPSRALGETRTLMAADRTLMAWLRTALSMLSFGFTIYKFLEDFEAKRVHTGPNLPQNVGLFLAGIGTASILMGVFEYWGTLKELNLGRRFGLSRPVLVLSLVMLVAGILLFLGIALSLF